MSFPSFSDDGVAGRPIEAQARRFAEIAVSPPECWRPLGRACGTIGWRELPAGDHSGRGSYDLTIVSIRSRVVRADVDFGAGRFSADFRSGDFALIPPLVDTTIVAHQAHALRILAMPFHDLVKLAPDLDRLAPMGNFEALHARKNTDGEISRLIDIIEAESANDAPDAGLIMDGALLQVIGRLARAAHKAPALLRETLTPYQIKRLDDYIDAHLSERITLADLADVLGLSVFHMARAYRNSVGQPLQGAVRRRRMSRARDLLVAPRASVTKVALELGFATPQSFSRAFSRAYHCSPVDVIRAAGE